MDYAYRYSTGISIKGLLQVRVNILSLNSLVVTHYKADIFKNLKMKWVIILSTLVVLATTEDKYSPENDDFEVEALGKNPEALKSFLECFLDVGPCDEEAAADFKKDIAEAVEQACAKCTVAQKHIFKRFLEILKVKDLKGYKDFQQKYDPENKYLAALESAISSS